MRSRKREAKYQISGWVLFILCAVLFLLSAFRDGDSLLALASLVFLSGCILFLIPLVFPGTDEKRVAGDDGAGLPENDE
jgi:hypothetical protein